jgi:peptidoglycan/LPS O-acetylase OafA/YrhL
VHLWSLSVQEQFYLILPWFLLYTNEKYLKPLIIGAILLGFSSRYYDVFINGKPFAFLFYHRLGSLGLGVLYAYFVYKGKRAVFEKYIKFALPILLYLGWQMSMFRGTMVGIIYERTMWTYMGLCIIIFAINNKNKLAKKYFFDNKALNYFGKISYGIYLYHYPLGTYFDYFFSHYNASHHLPYIVSNFVFIYIVKLSIVLLVASLSYNYIETPIINLKKRFNYVKAKAPTA